MILFRSAVTIKAAQLYPKHILKSPATQQNTSNPELDTTLHSNEMPNAPLAANEKLDITQESGGSTTVSPLAATVQPSVPLAVTEPPVTQVPAPDTSTTS